MSPTILLLAVAVVIGTTLIVYRSVPSRFARLTRALLVVFWAGVFTFLYYYIFDARFGAWINTFVKPSRFHISYASSDNEPRNPDFPLPPRTAFRYRNELTRAVYYSRSTVDTVVQFYRTLVPPSDAVEKYDGDPRARHLDVLYRGVTYSVTVTKEGNGSLIAVKPTK